MAKVPHKEKLIKKKTNRIDTLSLETINYQILIAGVVVIVVGFIALSFKPWDNSIAMTVAPILLVLGYCVIVPIGIIYRKKKGVQDSSEQLAEQA